MLAYSWAIVADGRQTLNRLILAQCVVFADRNLQVWQPSKHNTLTQCWPIVLDQHLAFSGKAKYMYANVIYSFSFNPLTAGAAYIRVSIFY